MIVRELVGLAHLRLTVVVDAGGLDRPIRWVYATELEDPSVYLRGGELVLTNGLWRRTGTPASRFVEVLCRGEVCALAYGLEAVTRYVPEELVDACREHELPLLSVPHPVSFGAISQAVADRSAEGRQAALLYALRRNKALVEAIAKGSGVDGVLHVLAAEQALSPSLHDQGGRVLTSAGPSPSAAEVRAVARTIMVAPRYPAPVDLDDGARGTLFAVPRERPSAFLLCRKGRDELSGDERAVIDQTVTFLGLVVAQRRAIQTLEMRFATELIEHIATGASRAADPRTRLEAFGLDPDGPLVAVALHTERDRALAGEIAAAHFAAHGAPAVVAEADEEMLLLVAWPGAAEALRRAAEELAERVGAAVDDGAVSVGLGSLQRGTAALRPSLVEARHACRAARAADGGPRVVTYRESASYRHLLAMHDRELRHAFRAAVLQPLVEHDARHRGSLVHTLTVFLRNTGQWKRTADELHVHVNTLRHRLRRIEELTGRDMSSMDDRVDFYVALAGRDGADGDRDGAAPAGPARRPEPHASADRP